MKRPFRPVALFHATFLVTGMATVLLGVLLAQSTGGHAQDGHAGRLLTAQYCGQLLGSLLLARQASRSLAAGLGVIIAAGAFLARTTRPAMLPVFLLGLGLGTVMASVNTGAGLETTPDRRGRVLELLNVFWPVGAALCAPVTMVVTGGGSLAMFGVVAGLLGVCLLWLLCTRSRSMQGAPRSALADRTVSLARLCLLALVALLVIGVETSVSAWLPTLSRRFGSAPGMLAATTAAFWTGSLVSRATAAQLLRRITLGRLCGLAAAGTVLSCTLLPVFAHPAALLIAAAGAAFCLGPLYPALLSRCVDLRGKQLVFLCAGVGSAAAPWAVGQLSGITGSLRCAMFLPAVLAALMAAAMRQTALFAEEES